MASKLLSKRMFALLISRWMILGWPKQRPNYRNKEKGKRRNRRDEESELTILVQVSKSLCGSDSDLESRGPIHHQIIVYCIGIRDIDQACYRIVGN